MKLNRNYWVLIDSRTGHAWNDWVWDSKKEALAWYNDPWSKPKLKLKKIRIVEIKEPK